MICRSLVLASVFLAALATSFAQESTGDMGSTDSRGDNQRPPEPALREDVTLSDAPLGGIQRRDLGPVMQGELQYTISAGQSFETGAVPGANGTPESTSISGTLNYHSDSARNQFGLMYSGGAARSSQMATSNNDFQNFEIRDTLRSQRLTLTLSDYISYLPQTPTVGTSGIPGMGDLSGILGFGSLAPMISPTQTILSQNAQRVSNALAGSLTYSLTGRTSITAMGSYGILRFVDTAGFDSDQEMSGATINHRFSARDTIGLKYAFGHLGYSGSSAVLDSDVVSLLYERLWSRRWRSDFELGPQWVIGSQASTIPSSINASGNASVTYNLTNVSSVDLRYTRGVSGGSGILQGSRVDSIALAATHSFGRYWSASVTGTYSRNVGLAQDELFIARYAGAQLTRQWRRYLSGYFSYTAINQSTSGGTLLVPVQVVQGLYHVFSFGIRFTSRPVHTRGV